MQTYTVTDKGDEGYRLVKQDLGEEGIQTLVLEHGMLICKSCGAVLATVSSVLSTGEACWCCGTRIHSFTLT